MTTTAGRLRRLDDWLFPAAPATRLAAFRVLAGGFALVAKPARQPSRAVERMTRVLLVDQPHLCQVFFAGRSFFVIVARPRNTQQFTLPGDRDPQVSRFDHFLPNLRALQIFF